VVRIFQLKAGSINESSREGGYVVECGKARVRCAKNQLMFAGLGFPQLQLQVAQWSRPAPTPAAALPAG